MRVITIAAFSFDTLSAIAIFIDQRVKDRNTERVNGLQGQIAALEASLRAWEQIKFPGGAQVEGQDANEIVKIMTEGARDAVDANKKLLVETLNKIANSSKFPWGYIAIVLLVIGIVLHVVDEATKA